MPLLLSRGGHRVGRRNKELLASIGFEDEGGKGDTWELELQQALLAIRGARGGVGGDGGELNTSVCVDDAITGKDTEPSPAVVVGGPSATGADDSPNAATKLVIQCLKEGLAKSISSISHRQKDRPLNPRSDFTFKCCINFKERKVGRQRRTTRIRTREGDMGCCGGSIATKGDPMDSDSDSPSDDDVEEDEESGSDLAWEDSEKMRELAAAADRPGGVRSRAPSLTPRQVPAQTPIGSMSPLAPTTMGATTEGNGFHRRMPPPPLLTNRPPPTESHEPFSHRDYPAAPVMGSVPPNHRRVMSYSMKYPMRAPDLDGTIASPLSEEGGGPPPLPTSSAAAAAPPPVHPASTYPGRGTSQLQDPTRGPDATGNPTVHASPVDDRGPREAFTFTDYSPMCYRHIRTFFKVDAKDYRDVLCHSRWHSIPTPGKSAAQLFFCGQNWVIKTMTKEESKFLRSILHRYYNHVRDNPGTLLPHFVGHHSISIKGEKITFVIMQNVFATPNRIDEKFDLKGSTVGRYVSEKEKRKKTCTKKDLDINRPIHVGPERRTVLIKQLQVDCLFLERCNIMDYSFLVGIHYHQFPEQPHQGGRGGTAASSSMVSPDMGGGGGGGGGGMSFIGASPKMTRTTGTSEWQRAGGKGGGGAGDITPNNEAQSTMLPPKRGLNATYESFTEYQGGMLSNPLFTPVGGPSSNNNNMASTLFSGGPRKHSHEIYYVGIIDILQEYNWWKRGETIVRRATNDVQQISSVDPHLYSTRFVSFMTSIIT